MKLKQNKGSNDRNRNFRLSTLPLFGIELVSASKNKGNRIKNSWPHYKIARSTHQLSALYSVSAILTRSLDLDIILNKVAKKMTGIFSFAVTRIVLFESKVDEPQVRASFGSNPKFNFQSADLLLGKCSLEKVVESGKPMIVENVHRDSWYRKVLRLSILREANFSFMAVFPIKKKERTIGAIIFNGKNPRQITPDEIQMITSMVEQIGVAVENATLLEKSQARANELLAENVRLYETLKQSNKILQRADRLSSLGMLTSGLAHEIRNPLVAIRTFAQLLPERYRDEKFRTNFQSLALKEVDRICDLVNELLSFARPSPLKVAAEKVNEIVASIARILEMEAKERNVKLQLYLDPKLPKVMINKGQIKQVVMNVIMNGIQSIENGGKLVVRTSLAKGDCSTLYFQIKIKDTGIGIREENIRNIFDPFFTTRANGSGLGLAISQQIIHEHGGCIDVLSKVGKGSTFFIKLPVQ